MPRKRYRDAAMGVRRRAPKDSIQQRIRAALTAAPGLTVYRLHHAVGATCEQVAAALHRMEYLAEARWQPGPKAPRWYLTDTAAIRAGWPKQLRCLGCGKLRRAAHAGDRLHPNCASAAAAADHRFHP